MLPDKSLWNQRAQTVLHALVERYIQTGRPVSSRALSSSMDLNFSAATVRNVMADLEVLGYIQSPHTSAGRFPTARGYRQFVDTMLRIKPLRAHELQCLRRNLAPEKKDRELCEQASGLLSELAQMAGLVTVQRRGLTRLKQVEFISLDRHRVLAILILRNGEVENLILEMERDYGNYELVNYANCLNEHFAGKDLEEVREQIVKELHNMREHMTRVMFEAMRLAGQVFGGLPDKSDVVLSGQTNLMQFEEFADVDHLCKLFSALGEKQEILNLLDKCSRETQGVKIYIGQESGYQALCECSIVSAPYAVDNQIVGTLAVIGPTRMAYDRIVPLVDITAKLLGKALKESP